MTLTCWRESDPLVKTAFAPPSILVRNTVTQSLLFFTTSDADAVAVVTMA